jgi:glucose-1-phosphate adenylyltransferase
MPLGTRDILALVLAGGKGERLYPLTLERTKPSVPFGGKYRIIDFSLSNLVNSHVFSIYVLVQYKSQSLIEHIRTTWSTAGIPTDRFITVVPPQMRKEEVKEWYRGTADSVFQNVNLIYDFKPRIVIILSGDHIYRMDLREMVNYHFQKKSDVTLSVIPLKENAHQFGVVKVDRDSKVVDFKEKPKRIEEGYFISMGIYIFNTEVLIRVLEEDSKRNTSHDFGKDIIPSLVRDKADIFAYDFSKNRIPSLKDYEAKFYWRDVGTIKSYWEANMDLLGEKPLLDLDNQDWPVYASNFNCPPAYIEKTHIQNSLISEGSKVMGARIINSILGRGVRVDRGTIVENSIIMDFTQIGKNCKIKSAIIDRFNTIEDETFIGYNREKDKKCYHLDPSGIVVLRRGSRKLLGL